MPKCTLKHCPKDAIVIPRSWLERLLEYAEKANFSWNRMEKTADTQVAAIMNVMDVIGFARTVKAILKLNKK